MNKKEFDYGFLDDLNTEEILSLLKSNIMDWDLRKKIRGILKTREIRKAIIDFLPLIATIGVASEIIGITKDILDRL